MATFMDYIEGRTVPGRDRADGVTVPVSAEMRAFRAQHASKAATAAQAVAQARRLLNVPKRGR